MNEQPHVISCGPLFQLVSEQGTLMVLVDGIVSWPCLQRSFIPKTIESRVCEEVEYFMNVSGLLSRGIVEDVDSVDSVTIEA